MSIVTTLMISGGIASALGWMAMRDHRIQQARRRGLLDDCARLFDRYALTHGGDSFPRLSGRSGTRNVDARLISDTMTIRRLPQLWLQVTVLERTNSESEFAVLVRPSGYEFYSLTTDFPHAIERPASFPHELIIRGSDYKASKLFEKLAPVIADILTDPRVKEVAVTRKGLRIIRQAGEGRRGEYLLLRQAVFDDAAVSADMLESLLSQIENLKMSLAAPANEARVA